MGASNIEDLMTGIIKYNDAHLETDYFLNPVTPGNKEMRESIAMIEHLAENGVTPEKIKFIFNRVVNAVTEDFAPLFKFHKAKGLFTLAEKAAILKQISLIYCRPRAAQFKPSWTIQLTSRPLPWKHVALATTRQQCALPTEPPQKYWPER